MTSHPLHDPNDARTSWALNPWMPMSVPIDLKHMGKLLEELAELAECNAVVARCAAAAARCIIQGINESEPITGKPNKVWLEDECADVLANIELVTEHFGLDRARMQERTERKKAHLRGWHSMLDDKAEASK